MTLLPSRVRAYPAGRPSHQLRPGVHRVQQRREARRHPFGIDPGPGRARSTAPAARFLRQGVRFDDLDRAAAAHSDLQAAKALNRARDELFRKVHGTVPVAA